TWGSGVRTTGRASGPPCAGDATTAASSRRRSSGLPDDRRLEPLLVHAGAVEPARARPHLHRAVAVPPAHRALRPVELPELASAPAPLLGQGRRHQPAPRLPRRDAGLRVAPHPLDAD